MKTSLMLLALALLTAAQIRADDDKPNPALPAANAINALGVDLLKKTSPGENALLSPYSIDSALAMAYAGAAGKTRDEMAAVLHFPKDPAAFHSSFAELRKGLEQAEKYVASTLSDDETDKHKAKQEPALLIAVANRLFGQTGYAFREPFLALVKDSYGAPFQQLDFAKDPRSAVKTINDWVGERTHDRIKNLVPDGGITPATRLVLVNAIYFKAAWSDKFDKSDTKPGAFHVNGGDAREVPTMFEQTRAYYVKRDGYTAVTFSYIGHSLHFAVILPDDPKGLPALEEKLTPAMLGGLAWPKLSADDFHLVNLWMPKLKLEPSRMELGKFLRNLGMKSAFDDPKGSADFDGMAARKPDDYLSISVIFHKTFLSLDESGTEAAGATAVLMAPGGAPPPPEEPKEVHVDCPFLFAIQDSYSGACLFLGRVTDPR